MRRLALALLLSLVWFTPARAAIIYPPNTGGSINGNLTVRSGDTIGFSSSATDSTVACDTCLVRIGSDILALQRGATEQTFRVYSTATKFGYITAAGGATGGDIEIAAPSGGALRIGASTNQWYFSSAGLLLFTNNTLDLGGSNAVRSGYFGTSVVIGAAPATALTGSLFIAGVTNANLGTPSNGTVVFCTDCDPPTLVDSTCTSTGTKTGSLAFRVNGAWKCIS